MDIAFGVTLLVFGSFAVLAGVFLSRRWIGILMLAAGIIFVIAGLAFLLFGDTRQSPLSGFHEYDRLVMLKVVVIAALP